MTRRITTALTAKRHIETIAAHLTEAFGVEVAERSVDSMTQIFQRLARYPHLGQPTPQNPSLLRFSTRHVRIIYRVDDITLEIVAVVPSRMSFRPGIEG